MKGLFSDYNFTFPTRIRQMMADQLHSPHPEGKDAIEQAKADFIIDDLGDPINAQLYFEGRD